MTTKPVANQQQLIEALQRNYRAEMEGAVTYRALADKEKDARRADVIRRMADNEEQHAARWAGRLSELGAKPPAGPFKPHQDVMLSAKVSSIDNALRKLEASEDADVDKYKKQIDALHDPASTTILNDLIKDEEGHSKSLHSMAAASPATDTTRDPQSQLSAILHGEKHASTGSWIGDAIYGVNDGLGSIFGIVSGFSGATGGNHLVLLAGLAGMVASAVSM